MNDRNTWQMREFHGALAFIVVVQTVLLLLSSTILDGGYIARIVFTAVVGYWFLVLWIALRRRNTLTKADVIVIRSGFYMWLPIAALVMTVMQAVANKV